MSARKTPHKPGPLHLPWSSQLCSSPCLPLPSHVFGVPHPVYPSPPMSLVFLTLFAPPFPCFWCPSPCLPLPSYVFGFPPPVCPSPPMSLVSLTLFASPIPCLWCPFTLFAPPLPCLWCYSPCLPLPSHVFGAPLTLFAHPPLLISTHPSTLYGLF